MTAPIDLFRTLSNTLDDLVRKVDPELPLAEDIHPAIRRISEYAAGLVRLPAELAKARALKASADAVLPAREESVRKAKHPVTMLEAKLKKLTESIDRNRLAASNEQPAPVAVTVPISLAAKLPATRQEIVEGLHAEKLAAEADLAKARAAAKKAESNRKGAVTRAANLAFEVLAAEWAIVDHDGRLEETVKLLRKTIAHLQNRQAKRDRKRAAHAPAIETVDATVDQDPKGPTDEDIRKMAASEGLTIDGPDDIEAARQLFFN